MAKWIAIADDDMGNLKMAGHVLSKSNMRVSAMNSGKALLQFMRDNHPDLILLDIMMPEMDGFETLKRLREQEKSLGQQEVPVVFLTAEESKDIESRGLELGASDFIRKPFLPEVLRHRIQTILANHEKIHGLEEEVNIDKLTGLLNKVASNKKLTECCQTLAGSLMVVDLDSFKLVNDLHGHETGDKVLIAFSQLLHKNTSAEDIVGRIGGDEFIVFLKDCLDEQRIQEFAGKLNEELRAECVKILGEEMNIPIGVSIGSVYVPEFGTDYEQLFKMADKALYFVKLNGKHGAHLYREGQEIDVKEENVNATYNLQYLSKIMEERNETNCALFVGQEAFTQIYRFMLRFIKSYNGKAYKVLFSISPKNGWDKDPAGFEKVIEEFGEHVKNTLRKSDLMMQSKSNQFFLLLPEVNDLQIDGVVGRILDQWEKLNHSGEIDVLYELEMMTSAEQEGKERRGTPDGLS